MSFPHNFQIAYMKIVTYTKRKILKLQVIAYEYIILKKHCVYCIKLKGKNIFSNLICRK